MGPEHERRKDDVRLALLEQTVSTLKESVDLLHTRVTQQRQEQAVHLDAAVNTIVEKIENKWEDCSDHKERTAKSESAISYHLINAGATWTALCAVGYWALINITEMREAIANIMLGKGVH